MVAPIQLKDPSLQRAYLALSGSKVDARDVDRLLGVARSDGKIDAVERKDLLTVLESNRDMFAPADRQRLLAGLDAPALGSLLSLPKTAATPNTAPPPKTTKPKLATPPKPAAPADATAVRRPPIVATPTPTPVTRTSPAERRPVAPPDATRVHIALTDPRNPGQNPLDPHGIARSLSRAHGIPDDFRPRHETISAADPRTLTPEYRAAVEAELTRRRAQTSIDQQCDGDPFAASVNGMWKSPTGSWERVGPSPLEVVSETAFVGSVPGRVVSALTAGKAVYEAIDDPTAGNIGTAALKVGLTGGGEYAKLVHSPLKPAITVTKGVYNAQTHGAHNHDE